jgi:hypothetical protein
MNSSRASDMTKNPWDSNLLLSVGIGIGAAVGMAIAAKIDKLKSKYMFSRRLRNTGRNVWRCGLCKH